MVINFQTVDCEVLQESEVPMNYQRMIKSCEIILELNVFLL